MLFDDAPSLLLHRCNRLKSNLSTVAERKDLLQFQFILNCWYYVIVNYFWRLWVIINLIDRALLVFPSKMMNMGLNLTRINETNFSLNQFGQLLTFTQILINRKSDLPETWLLWGGAFLSKTWYLVEWFSWGGALSETRLNVIREFWINWLAWWRVFFVSIFFGQLRLLFLFLSRTPLHKIS